MALILKSHLKHIALGLTAAALFGFSASAAAGIKAVSTAAPSKIERLNLSAINTNNAFSNQDTAIRFVEYTGIDKNLSLLLLSEVKTSPQVASAINEYGFETVKGKVVKAIKKVQQQNNSDWTLMLADVYLHHFNNLELQSILTERENSPHFAKMVELQSSISVEINTNGSTILNRARQQVFIQLEKELAA